MKLNSMKSCIYENNYFENIKNRVGAQALKQAWKGSELWNARALIFGEIALNIFDKMQDDMYFIDEIKS